MVNKLALAMHLVSTESLISIKLGDLTSSPVTSYSTGSHWPFTATLQSQDIATINNGRVFVRVGPLEQKMHQRVIGSSTYSNIGHLSHCGGNRENQPRYR